MNSAAAWSVALVGMQPTMVQVEVALGRGLPRTVLVGLPDAALYEARDRCHAAVASAGLQWPTQLVTINLSPATLPKAGSHFDLAIVTAVLAAAEVVPADAARRVVTLGELGLDGSVRPVRGVLPALLAAREQGFASAIVPARQLAEANLVGGLTVWGVANIADLLEVLHGRPVQHPLLRRLEPSADEGHQLDLADVVGQSEAKYALEVAAAGRHHIFLTGAPGVGKTMLAERLPGLLPDLTEPEALEVSAVHSLAGEQLEGLVTRPPYRDPHHSASLAALVGGGARIARPGVISLVHRGVLFLDEVAEFAPRTLEALRTPLECGWVTISRSAGDARYPASFQLVMASNPCPCGNHGVAGAHCRCPSAAVRRYQERLSGPILDRVDITQQMLPVRKSLLKASMGRGESSQAVAQRVAEARLRQARRLRESPWHTNADVPGYWLRERLALPQGIELLDEALLRGRLSARGLDRVLRVSWTIADLEGHGRPSRDDLRAALQLREGEPRAAA